MLLKNAPGKRRIFGGFEEAKGSVSIISLILAV